MEIAGKAVLVTGGAGALGRAITSALVQKGARVAVIDRDDAALAALKASAQVATGVSCDLTDPAATESALQKIIAAIGPIDVLLNCAGLIHSEPLAAIGVSGVQLHDVDRWRKVLAANLDTTFFTTRAVVAGMIKNRTKGVVVTLSSIAAGGTPGQSAYAAAKAGVDALTKVWAEELGPLGIRFVGIAPGYIDTPTTRAAVAPQALKDITSRVPLRRLGAAGEIADAVVAAVANDYLHGVTIPVSGGFKV